jgi:predicted amidohydrolase YtcJ
MFPRSWRRRLPAALACAIAACGGPDHEAADRVFLGGKVYTVDASRSRAEAIAVRSGRIVAVGSDADIRAWIGEGTEVTDLHGHMLLPGFHDSHIHLLIGVATKDDCDLMRLESREAVAERLKGCAQLRGYGADRWILGGGWSEWLWPDANPRKADLDAMFPDRPVYLESSFGHAAWVNSRALALAGVDRSTPDPDDGVIEHDAATGEPSGTLRDAAMLLVKTRVPERSAAQRRASVLAAIALAHRNGITAVIEPGLDAELIAPVVALADSHELDLRVRASLSPINWQPGAFDDGVFSLLESRGQWRRPDLDVDSVKIYMDGVVEFGTGALLHPYAKAGFGLGPRFYTQEQVNRYFTRFDAMGLQIHVHAVGDAGIRMALDGFEAMRKANGMNANRHQIVHLQLIDDADIPRFARLGIAATFQPLWAYPDLSALELDVPMIGKERTYEMYPIGSVARAGGRIVGGSDYYVTDLNPLLAIETGVTRQNPYDNEGPVLDAAERVDLDTMIAAYTIQGAWQMNREAEHGSIEVGKRADLVVLDRDLFGIPAAEISEANVVMTVFDGRTVYAAGASRGGGPPAGPPAAEGPRGGARGGG